MNVLTADGSLPTPADPADPYEPAGPEAGGPGHPRWWLWGVLMVFLLVLTLLGLFLPIPYYAISPGEIRSAQPHLDGDGPSFPDEEGEVSFATVSLQQVTPLGALAGWLDPTTDVKPEDEVLIGGSSEENRQVNAQLMDDSKTSAEVAAFAALGCDVLSGTGAAIAEIQEGLPADGVLAVGDTITAADGVPIEVGSDLGLVIDDADPGDALTLTVEDEDGVSREEEVVLAENPDDPDEARLGVVLGTRDLEVDLPFEVEIDSGQVGGPSAGLAFTLALLDEMTAGSLTGGQNITATGTIDARGQVGPVGGVTQKTAAVRRAGDTLFLVPPDELEEAEAAAGDDLDVVAVTTLDEALAVLAERGGDVDAITDSDICASS
jgi:PDZ domain-containing protein